MKQNWMQKIARFIKEHKMKKQWQMAATVMAAVVVFSTTYALILPAITLTKDNVYTSSDCQTASNSQKVHVGQMNSGSDKAAADVQTPSNATQEIYYCGFEAHTHDKDCYNDEGHLVCEETVHVHTEECLIQFTEEELALIQNVIDMIAELPTSEEAEAALEAFETENDKEGFEAYVKAIAEIAWAAHDAYEALDEDLQAEVTNIDLLRELEWLWSKTILFEYPSLEADGAYVSKLNEKTSNVITDSEEEPDPMTVQNGDAIEYQFSVETDSYSDMYYSEGRVKVEFVLPFAAEEAEFDLTDMNWLDNSEGYEAAITTETRTIGDEEIECQVLTGYKYFAAEEASEEVIPGNFTGNVVVSVNEMEHNEEIAILISAAMEYNEWDGECAEHEREEKLTITTDEYKVYAPLSPEEQKAIYEAFLAEVEEAEANGLWTEELRAAAEELLERVTEAFTNGELSEEYYQELYDKLYALLSMEFDPDAQAEQAIGDNWLRLKESGWFEEYSDLAETEELAVEETVVATPMMFKTRARMMSARASIGDSADASDVQVDRVGGEQASADNRVSVSKTIDGTDVENVFDITLKVKTEKEITEVYEEPDMAVVIVMDISNTMNSDFPKNNENGETRYTAAMIAAENFLDKFAAETDGISRVGYVAFNTSGHKIFDLQPCATTAKANALKNEMRTETKKIVSASDYGSDHTRFTNVEAGLAMAADMLADAPNDNKYIIFLSDGFPTTYLITGTTTYEGYDPYCGSGEVGTPGVFYDDVRNVYCPHGTSYSDTAAVKAREKADEIKAKDIEIFSIGVDVGGQTVQQHIKWGITGWNKDGTPTMNSKASIVECPDGTVTYGTDGSVTYNITFEIGNTQDSYKEWLRNSIGSGYYYDSANTAGLDAAYSSILAEIRRLNEQASEAEWVAVDPMPVEGDSAYETIEFIGFYTKENPTLVGTSISGQYAENAENTASFAKNDFGTSDTSDDRMAIRWDLKDSGYTKSEEEIPGTSSTKTVFNYELVYRVRLKNELEEFVEGNIYDTNDITSLTYRLIETVDGTPVASEVHTLHFPIPAVHGYLGELEFIKIDSFDKPVVGAEFTLTHDRLTCTKCRGDGTSYVDIVNDRFVADEKYVAVSDAEGKVTFTRIPSGHKYTLVETKVPNGYVATNDEYTVEVAYNDVTVKVNGSADDWEGSIINHTSYELPQTGGPGTWLYTLSGLLLTVGTMIFGFIQRREQERRAM